MQGQSRDERLPSNVHVKSAMQISRENFRSVVPSHRDEFLFFINNLPSLSSLSSLPDQRACELPSGVSGMFISTFVSLSFHKNRIHLQETRMNYRDLQWIRSVRNSRCSVEWFGFSFLILSGSPLVRYLFSSSFSFVPLYYIYISYILLSCFLYSVKPLYKVTRVVLVNRIEPFIFTPIETSPPSCSIEAKKY